MAYPSGSPASTLRSEKSSSSDLQGGSTPVRDSRVRWTEPQDDLRCHQSLTSVINKPPRSLGKIKGISDVWAMVQETVEEVREEVLDLRAAEGKGGADSSSASSSDAALGPIPEMADFQAYLDTFQELWEVYARSMRPRGGVLQNGHGLDAADNDAACNAHHSVPHEYFQSEFKLEHHQIFRQSLQTSVERQEELNVELTGHLDMVEVSLFEHIRRAQRDQLFDSLARLGEPLQEDLRTTLSVIIALRARLAAVQRKQLRCGIAVGRLARRKRRVSEVLQRLACLADVQQSQPSIEILLQGQDYATALDLLQSTKTALDTDLKGLASVKPGNSRLADLSDTFDRAVQADFVHHAAEAILSANDEDCQELRGAERLRCLCYCLARRELLKATLSPSSTLRDVLLQQLKKEIRSHSQALLLELSQQNAAAAAAASANTTSAEGADTEDTNGRGASNEGANSGSSNSVNISDISSALLGLPFESFLSFWKQILRSCIDIAHRFCEFAALVQETAAHLSKSAEDGGNSNLQPGDVEVSGEVLRLFEVIMNSMLQKTGVLLQARQGAHQSLKVADWHQLLDFTQEVLEKVRSLHESCGQRLRPKENTVMGDIGGNLRAILYAQTKVIIEEFHKQRQAQIEQVLEQERWDRTDVPQPYRHKLEQLVGQDQTEADAPDQTPAVERYLRVDTLNFLVVPAVLTLIQLLVDYVQLCRDFESLSAEIVQRMASLLRYFNQQTLQLILKGGRGQKYKVKITAANLALCSQSCGLMAKVLPKLQANLLEILQSGSGGGAVASALLGDLPKIAIEYEDHRNALFSKLSDLLRERFEVHAKSWMNTAHPEVPKDYSMSAGEGGGVSIIPHSALDGLVKDFAQMYKVLFKNLTGPDVKKIFAKAFADIGSKFEQRLGQALNASSPPYEDQVGRSLGDRLAMDVAFLQEQLSEKNPGIATQLQHLVFDLLHHLQTKLQQEEPLRRLHPACLEALQRAGMLPQ
mmetsp:Transcript_119860/g.208063  ORF Transcript_119860/g.208063 Transcript_119860/m.208063 type:complete len:986 (+) Transcript_119860:111-3068(+)